MLRRLPLLAFGVLLLGGCGAVQGAPAFVQTYGTVDEPCAASVVVAHCTAHVFLVNRGGDGIGHATIVVQTRDNTATSSSRTAPAAVCGTPIPETPAGGYADLTCNFDLPPGATVSSAPHLRAVDYAFAVSAGSSTNGTSALATLVLAAIAGLLAVAALAAAAGRRRPLTGSRAGRPAQPDEAQPDGDDENSW